MGVPRIDFYVLPDQKDNGRALLACRLADKAYSLGHTVYVLAGSEAQAAALDDLLWTFRQDSFIPHERYPLVGEESSPVLIGGADRDGFAGGGDRASADQFRRPAARRLRALRAGGGAGGSASRGAGEIARAVPAVPGAGLRAGDAQAVGTNGISRKSIGGISISRFR